MCKRLRGWKLEEQVGIEKKNLEKGKALEEGKTSNLATALLNGKLSAIQIRKLAHAATLDGCDHPELEDMARCGSYGQQPGNVHRDLMCKFVKNIVVPCPMEHEITCIDPKSLKKEKVLTSIFLPHIIFSELAKVPNFHEIFPLEKVEKFWNDVERSKDPRLENHPCKSRAWKKFSIPIWLHGDGVEYAVRDSLMVWSWGPLMTNFNPLESKFLIACFAKSATAPSTWDDIMEQVCWSLNALLQGRHPMHDASGAPLKKGSPFYEQRGLPLASGFRAVVWSIQGDAEFFALHLGLPHWASHRPCMQCNCLLSDEDKSMWVKNIQMDKQAFRYTSNSEAIENPPSNHPLSHQIPGLSTSYVRGDALHILWVHGIYSHLLGSILHYIVYHDPSGPGRRQKKPPQERLAILWEALQKAYVHMKPTTRVTNLKLSMFVNVKEPHSSYPALNLKGSESKHFLPAFLEVCQTLLDRAVWQEGCMLDCMQSMQSLVDLYNQADIIPSAQEHEQAMTFAKGFLDTYSFLQEWALEEGRLLFHVVHKFHSFQHLVEGSKHLNPRACWCFANEDYVGRISQLVFSISPGVRSSKLSFKVGPKYRLLLHFLLTRADFSLASDVAE